jgi:hypothetical protein
MPTSRANGYIEQCEFNIIIMNRATSIPIMGETSSLTKNTAHKASLRTTVPMFIVKHLNVKPGDHLDWSIEAVKDQTVVVVRKAKK